jgi:protein disulfide-isomerase A1
LAEKFAIKGFPTIAFFKNGKKIEYNAGRTAGDIVAWLKKQSGPATKTIHTAAQLLAAQESNKVIVVGYFSSAESAAAKAFLSPSLDSIVILKTFDDKRAEIAATDLSPAQIYGFILGNSVPLVQTFYQEAIKKIFSSRIQKHVLFFTETSSNSPLTEVAKAVKGEAIV